MTLPQRAARIRLASEAESAATPAPNMRPPRLIGNKGEIGEFVLPLRVPTAGAAGGALTGFDDFTFDAASWTLTAHEARPGHELQFASLVEKGVSLARAVFAFNSVNVEGWALYAEAEMKPYLPLDGQLVALQHRLMRAARAFLDPELQAGLDQAGRGGALPDGRGRALRGDGAPGGRALHVPRAGPGHVVLLRLPALDGAQVADRARARQELRPQALPRLPAGPGTAAAQGAGEDGRGRVPGRAQAAGPLPEPSPGPLCPEHRRCRHSAPCSSKRSTGSSSRSRSPSASCPRSSSGSARARTPRSSSRRAARCPGGWRGCRWWRPPSRATRRTW